MAASATKAGARRATPSMLSRLGATKPAKGGAQDGPKAVGHGTQRAKPNKILLGGLGLVAVAGLAKVAMPSLFGGGTGAVASFPAPLTNRHFLGHVTVTTVANGGGPAATGRPVRNPFTPPPGFGP